MPILAGPADAVRCTPPATRYPVARLVSAFSIQRGTDLRSQSGWRRLLKFYLRCARCLFKWRGGHQSRLTEVNAYSACAISGAGPRFGHQFLSVFSDVFCDVACDGLLGFSGTDFDLPGAALTVDFCGVCAGVFESGAGWAAFALALGPVGFSAAFMGVAVSSEGGLSASGAGLMLVHGTALAPVGCLVAGLLAGFAVVVPAALLAGLD